MCLFLWLILIYILSSKHTITSSIMAFSGFCESIQQIIKTEGGLSDAQTRNWCQSEDDLVDYSLTWHRIIKIIFSPGQRVGRFAKSSCKRQNCLIAGFFWNMPSPHVWVLPFPHHIDLWERGSENYTTMLLWVLVAAYVISNQLFCLSSKCSFLFFFPANIYEIVTGYLISLSTG